MTRRSLALVSLVGDDHDDAIDLFVGRLHFGLVDDSPVVEQAERRGLIERAAR